MEEYQKKMQYEKPELIDLKSYGRFDKIAFGDSTQITDPCEDNPGIGEV